MDRICRSIAAAKPICISPPPPVGDQRALEFNLECAPKRVHIEHQFNWTKVSALEIRESERWNDSIDLGETVQWATLLVGRLPLQCIQWLRLFVSAAS